MCKGYTYILIIIFIIRFIFLDINMCDVMKYLMCILINNTVTIYNCLFSLLYLISSNLFDKYNSRYLLSSASSPVTVWRPFLSVRGSVTSEGFESRLSFSPYVWSSRNCNMRLYRE